MYMQADLGLFTGGLSLKKKKKARLSSAKTDKDFKLKKKTKKHFTC